MKKYFVGLIIIFIFLTTFTPKHNKNAFFDLTIDKIVVENNIIIQKDEILDKLNFLYKENLFFLNTKKIEKNLKEIEFVQSYKIKKIYPNILKIDITETKLLAVLHNKKKKYYISNNGKVVNYKNLPIYESLPTVFGNGKNFYNFYKEIKSIGFPLEKIKSYYFFESERWDLLLDDGKIIKLPVSNYKVSLKNLIIFMKNKNYQDYNIFDYRIKHQLILN